MCFANAFACGSESCLRPPSPSGPWCLPNDSAAATESEVRPLSSSKPLHFANASACASENDVRPLSLSQPSCSAKAAFESVLRRFSPSSPSYLTNASAAASSIEVNCLVSTEKGLATYFLAISAVSKRSGGLEQPPPVTMQPMIRSTEIRTIVSGRFTFGVITVTSS